MTQAHRPFQPGDLALLVDRNGKHYLLQLQAGAEFVFHLGVLHHDQVLGQEEGVCVRTSRERLLWAYRPRMFEYVLEMPRSSAIVYPKDAAFMLMWADVFPGADVLEAGLGSGALTIPLLRAVGPSGSLTSCEVRVDMIAQAQRNVAAFLGPTPQWCVERHDVREGIPGGPYDRILLDLPDPWRVTTHAAAALAPGGVVCTYLPNVPQVASMVDALRAERAFAEIETFEALFRPWAFKGATARPGHGIIGHTGFITVARRAGKRDSPGL